MAVIVDFKNYLTEIMNEIAGINKSAVVVDPTQLTSFLSELTKDSNSFLCGVLPNFGNNSPGSADEHLNRGFTEIMLIDKIDLSSFDQETMVSFYDEIYVKMIQVQEKMKADHLSGECTFLKRLNPASMQIISVYNRSDFCGWNLIFTFDVD